MWQFCCRFCLKFLLLQLKWGTFDKGVCKKMRLVNISTTTAFHICHSLNLKGSTHSPGKMLWLHIYKVYVMPEIKAQQLCFLKVFFHLKHSLQVLLHWLMLLFCKISVGITLVSKIWKVLRFLHKKSVYLIYRKSL